MPNSPETYDDWRERQSQSRHARQQGRDAYLESMERIRRLEAPIPDPQITYSVPVFDIRNYSYDELLGAWRIKPQKPSPNKQIAKLREKIKMHEGQIVQINGYIEKARLEIKDLQEKLDKDEKE